jgi:hypothetical protein
MKNSFKQENLKSLFNKAAPHLLQKYFNNEYLLNNVDFEKERELKKQQGFTKFLMEEIEKIAADSQKGKVKADLSKIYLMRDSKAILGFIRDGSLKEETIRKIKEEDNIFNRSIILFLEEQKSFEEFYLVYDVTNNGGRWWSARNDYIEGDQEITDTIKNDLIDGAKTYLDRKNKDGNFCHKTITLGDKEFIFAYYEDLAQERIKIKGGELETTFSCPVNKVVFLYDKANKFMKIYGADKHIKEKMHKVAAKAIFKKEEIPKEQSKNEVYDIKMAYEALVNNQEIYFKIAPDSPIDKITPTFIKLHNPNSNERIEISAGEKQGQYNRLFDSLKKHIAIDTFSKNPVSFDEVEPLWIGFTAFYQDPFDKNKISKKDFKITNKNNICNIGDDDIDFKILDCLRDSGIIKIKEDQEPANSNDKPSDSKYNQAV